MTRGVHRPRTFLFLLDTYPAVDHMTPVMWTCLERGDRTLVVFGRRFPYRDDYRFRFLMRYPECRVLDLPWVASPVRAVRGAGRVRWGPTRLQALLHGRGVAGCFVDWGAGLGYGGGDPVFRPGLRELRHRLHRPPRRRDIRHIVNWVVPPFRAALLMAAYRAGIPRFCLPHGVWTFLNPDSTAEFQEQLRTFRGTPTPPKGFTAFVVTSEFHRAMMMRYVGLSPEVVQTWGSLRYSTEWMAVVREICPAPSWPEGWTNHTRLLFILPKWDERVDRARTLRLLGSLAERPDIAVVCKGHPRLDANEAAALGATLARPNVWFAAEAHTPGLVAGTAATIVLASSIGVDALQQGKPVIYPRFLHENRLVYDEWGGCLMARTEAEVHQVIDAIARGAPPVVPARDVERVVSEVVYGGREPYDAPAHYHARILQHLPAAAAP